MAFLSVSLWSSAESAILTTCITSQNNVIIVLDSREQLEDPSTRSCIVSRLQLKSQSDIALLSQAALRLESKEDDATSVEFLLFNETYVKRIVLVLLPTACSRHNCRAKPHALTETLKAVKGNEDTMFMLLSLTTDMAFAQACAVGRQYPLYSQKTDAMDKCSRVDIVINLPDDIAVDTGFVGDVQATIDNIRLAQRLVDMPPNLLHTDAYIAECREVATSLGCQINVIQGRDLERRGFGGLWGVGKASEHLPALVVLSHIPSDPVAAAAKSICMVGKGIVYDTGGLSIKTPSVHMAGMKTDMGGSASVLGGFGAAVIHGNLKCPLHALLCISENSVGPLSTRPDDVHVFLSGKTVEVNNTDAEGRLVLADGCFFAHRDLNPRVIIDIATLTGAQLIATGKNHAAIYCNDERLEDVAVAAGKASGDLTFPIPYRPEFYKKEYISTVADMTNIEADRENAPSSCAGQFIGNHLEAYLKGGGHWLHIDMAGPVGELGGRSTGYGVALLSRIVRDLQ